MPSLARRLSPPSRRSPLSPVAAALAVAAAAFVAAPAAFAQDVRAAEEAFRRGGERYLRRDFGAASNFYEASYRSAPSWQALLGAIRSHRQSEGGYHLTRAATLSLEFVDRYSTQRAALRIAQSTLTDLSPRLFRLSVSCGECEIEVDGVLQGRSDFFLEPGPRTITAHWGERLSVRRTIECSAGQTQTLLLERPPPPPPPRVVEPPRPPPPPPPWRFHPAVPIASGVVGVGLLTGAAVAWWADALPRGRRLIENAQMGLATPEQERAVYAAEDRTTGLLVAGSVVTAFAVGSAIFTRWSFGAPRREAAPTQSAWMVLPLPGAISVVGRF
jgi:hypothetical protein